MKSARVLWKCFWQLYKFVSAFCVCAIDLVPGSFRFGEILFRVDRQFRKSLSMEAR